MAGCISPCCKSTWYPRARTWWHKGPWPRRNINGFFTETTLKLIFSTMFWFMFSSQCGFQVLQWHAKIVGYSCIETCVVLCGVDYGNDRICAHAILRGLYNTSWTHFLPMPIAPCSTPSPYVCRECDSKKMEEWPTIRVKLGFWKSWHANRHNFDFPRFIVTPQKSGHARC